MEFVIKGRVWKFGDNINTDFIIPGRYKFKAYSLEEMLPHVFEDIRPEFARNVRKGDIIVAGRNFGCGSSREHAPRLLKLIGISAIIAKSFARIFFRNAINIGLPVIEHRELPDIVNEGNEVIVDLANGILKCPSRNYTSTFKPYPKFIMEILLSGGIVEYVKSRGLKL